MTLNENIKISIFKKIVDYKLENKDVFTHYWNNKEENYPDCDDIETYLKPYIDSGNYDWVEIQDASRFSRSELLEAVLTLNNKDRLYVDQIFIRVSYEGNEEIPQYYYGTEVAVVTNQNNPTNDYTLKLELDCWSTFGCKMHALMKDEDMTQTFLCNRKMIDRFKYEVYNETTKEWEPCDEFINDGKHRLGLNYITQPWLLNTGNYEYPLIQATDDLTKEKGDIAPLKLTDWLEMNGCDSKKLIKWEVNGAISYINCKDEYSRTDKSGGEQKGKTNYKYNNNRVHLKYTDMPLINDSYFNSKGKYRYMVVKFGSNNTWNYKLDSSDTAKMNAYSKAREQLAKYPDLQTLLSDVVLGGGKTCITTKKVETNKSNTGEYVVTHLNGEAICLIPIPKGQFEQLYLFYLNSHDKGIVLGNGTILGMVVNDIPPSVFAAALRKYNNGLNDSKMQTIGDKVSLYNDNELGELPFAWTSLRLDGQWDWTPYTELNQINWNKEAITDFTFSYEGGGWKQITDWFDAQLTDSPCISLRLRDVEKPEGYYILWVANTKHPGGGYDEIFYGKEGSWDFSEFIRKDDTLTIENYAYCFFHFKGGNLQDKSKWELLTFSRANYSTEASGTNLTVKFSDFKFNYSDGSWLNYISDSAKVKLINVIITFPEIYVMNKWFLKSLNTESKTYSYVINNLYYTDSSEHYFPTIFHDFSYIPITVAHKENDSIKGQGSWFKVFENMLTDPEIYGTNNRWSEPFLWGPQFYQWVYYVDGADKLTLTADQIDWFKIFKATWDINLRTNMTSTTNLKLDIDDIINENYPFSKSTSEFIITDQNKYPFTTEAYNNWFEQNAVSEATAKRAKDITNEFSRAKYPMSAGLNLFSSITGTALAGSSAGPWGALAGLLTGSVSGGISWGVGQKKLNLEIAEADQKWANDWSRQYGNLYGEPARIIPDGFASGSLLYTPNGPSTDSFELFRMFTINPEARDAIGEEVFTSGYPYMKRCKYGDYDNRSKFNIVNFSFDEKNAIVNNYLKREISKNTLIFSQQQFIDWFKAKCKAKIRLFKDAFNYLDMDELIKNNIEINLDPTPIGTKQNIKNIITNIPDKIPAANSLLINKLKELNPSAPATVWSDITIEKADYDNLIIKAKASSELYYGRIITSTICYNAICGSEYVYDYNTVFRGTPNNIEFESRRIVSKQNFNEKIIFNDIVSFDTIGPTILVNLPSFNSDVSLPVSCSTGTLKFRGGEFLNCDNMTAKITVNGQYTYDSTAPITSDIFTFSTFNRTAPCYTSGIQIAGTYADEMISHYPNRDEDPYRKLVKR